MRASPPAGLNCRLTFHPASVTADRRRRLDLDGERVLIEQGNAIKQSSARERTGCPRPI
jgi:hypothetical protein